MSLSVKNMLGGGGANVTIDSVKVNAKGIALTSLGLNGIPKTYAPSVTSKVAVGKTINNAYYYAYTSSKYVYVYKYTFDDGVNTLLKSINFAYNLYGGITMLDEDDYIYFYAQTSSGGAKTIRIDKSTDAVIDYDKTDTAKYHPYNDYMNEIGTDGMNVYLFGSDQIGYGTEIYKWIDSSNSWSLLSIVLSRMVMNPLVVTVGGKMYLFGGYDNSASTDATQSYFITTDSEGNVLRTAIASLPIGVGYAKTRGGILGHNSSHIYITIGSSIYDYSITDNVYTLIGTVANTSNYCLRNMDSEMHDGGYKYETVYTCSIS